MPSGIVFDIRKSAGIPMQVPCGSCLGCRMERSRQWAIRCVHEAKMHDENSFVTLTYDPENIPPKGSLDKKAFPAFIKRLRKRIGDKVRYLHAGEYGTNTRRPHYHAIIFGYGFPDKSKWTERMGNSVFRSEELEDVWGQGMCEIGTVTYGSAMYVAKYIIQKNAAEFYPSGIQPEFATMSNRPGIGKPWYDKWKGDVYPSDQIVIDGQVSKPPAYYDKLLDRDNPEMMQAIRTARAEKRHKEDETEERLRVRELCANARLNLRGERGL